MKTIFSSFIVVLTSCQNYISSSLINNEWEDFRTPINTEKDFEIAITPTLNYYANLRSGNNYGHSGSAYIGTSSLYKNILINAGLGGGLGSFNSSLETNQEESSFSTRYFKTNAQISYETNIGERSKWYPLVFGINYGKDSGEYFNFRMVNQNNTEYSVFTNDVFTYHYGTKFNFTSRKDNRTSFATGINGRYKEGNNDTPSFYLSVKKEVNELTFGLNTTYGLGTNIGFNTGYTFQ